MSKIYVASSWRNEYHQPRVCAALIEWGHQIYDFRHPPQRNAGFAWSDIDKNWKHWTNEQYIEMLNGEKASHGFVSDHRAMLWADTCVLVLPAGRSAHLEAGWFTGQGKTLVVYMPEKEEPDLMYLLGQHICCTLDELQAAV